eukprot:13499514-Alexandrium_andersonii.AAC.1
MSASLVGSEMCIRDRACSPCQKGSEALQYWGVRPGRLGGPGVRSLPVPVSYTHLTLPTICSV